MNIHYFKNKKKIELHNELLNLLRKKFALQVQLSMGQLTKTHMCRTVRRNIARIKTLLNNNN